MKRSSSNDRAPGLLLPNNIDNLEMMVDNLIEDGSNKKSISGMMPRRTRSIMPSLTRFRRRKDPPPMPKQLKPLPLEEGNQMLVIETPRSPSIKSGGSGRQLSPNFLMSTRKNAAADKEAMGFGDDNSFSNAREPLPPIRPPGLPSPTRRSAVCFCGPCVGRLPLYLRIRLLLQQLGFPSLRRLGLQLLPFLRLLLPKPLHLLLLPPLAFLQSLRSPQLLLRLYSLLIGLHP